MRQAEPVHLRADAGGIGGCAGKRGGAGWGEGRRPFKPPCAAAAASSRADEATRSTHQRAIKGALRAEGITTNAGLVQALMERGVPILRSEAVWTHTTAARRVGPIGA
jgi:hypothetical protein